MWVPGTLNTVGNSSTDFQLVPPRSKLAMLDTSDHHFLVVC